ncbi:unnamed protein product [Caenorhabditis sp. 36 PRJEB53466]|nr:unnamed protein product [Caenorhabditis sp. 36 PRJEB53466]
MSACRRIDDVALREVFRSVDAATLQKCRRVSFSWNEEILRLNKYTRKFTPSCLIMELDGTQFRLSVAAKSRRETFENPLTSPASIRRALCHVASPQTLNILVQRDSDEETFERMMAGIGEEWCREVKELEIATHSCDLKVSKILSHLEKFPQLVRLSLSHFSEEHISCAEIFRSLPELRYLRIYSFNGSDSSSGLVFDENAFKQLLENQRRSRRIQRIELFKTDVPMSMDRMIEGLRRLANVPMLTEPTEKPLLSEDEEEASAIHLLFDNCNWNLIKETHLLASIIRISSQFNFPTRQQEDDDILKGDFRFRLSDTNFVLKFMT